MQYHIDGELLPASDAVVPVTDRGFRYGDAAFERLRAYGGTVFEWESHADRLQATCSALALDHGFDRADLLNRIEETLSANELGDALVELTITRGSTPPRATIGKGNEPTVVVTVEPSDSVEASTESVTLQTVRTRQIPRDCLPGNGLTLNRLETAWAHQELASMATDNPADEALIRDLDDGVVGGTRSAIGFVTDAGLHTPSIEGRHPADIRTRLVLEFARSEDIPINRGAYDRGDLQSAAELFLVDTECGIRPVEAVDGVGVGGGPVTALLQRRLVNRVQDGCY